MLPDITKNLISALRHFNPIAKQAYPDQSEGMNDINMFNLTNDWLQHQLEIASKKYKKMKV